jgi:glycosyltransferase involved in cell wall biosynthesis
MMARPLVSIGLPVYNGERFLAGCLDSLLAQTYSDLEVVISDNASTDGTLAICERYAALDPRIRIFRSNENRGGAWNHNRVRELSGGEYFKWCGADDVIAPRFVEACVAALELEPAAVLAFPLSVVIDDHSQELRRTTDRLPLSGDNVAVRFGALLRSWSTSHNPFYGVVRRAALDRTRPLGAFLANDRCLLSELAIAGPFLQVEEYLMYRRLHAEHTARTRLLEQRLLNPHDDRPFRAREWIVLRESLKSVAHASLDAATKLRLAGVLSSWVVKRRMDFYYECRELAGETLRPMLRWGHTLVEDQDDVASSN